MEEISSFGSLDMPLPDSTLSETLRLSFADSVFEAVVSQAVLEHVIDPFQYASELHRVLKGEVKCLSILPSCNPCMHTHITSSIRPWLDCERLCGRSRCWRKA